MRTLALDQAVAMIPDGASLMVGGFMGVGTPERIIDEIVRQNKRDLTVIANDTAMPGRGIGKLVDAKLLRKAIVSHIGLNPETQRQMMAGELEVELFLRPGGGGDRGRNSSSRNRFRKWRCDQEDQPMIPAVKAKLLEGKKGLSSALPMRIRSPGAAPRLSGRSGLSWQ